MRTVVCRRYGGPDVLVVADMEMPTPAESEVLVQVRAAAVSPEDCAARKGRPLIARFSSGLTRPKHAVPGTEFAGEVAAVGQNVARFRIGDRVFGTTGNRYGAHAEYLTIPEAGLIAIMPESLDYSDAARPCGQLTAWHFLVEKAEIQSGHRVLINGASGSVGVAAVQLAKHFGAHVTAVCSTPNIEFVRSLGADEVVDYTQASFEDAASTYDIIFDVAGKSTFARSRASLASGGVYLSTALSLTLLLRMLITSRFGSRRAIYSATGLRSVPQRLANLDKLNALIESHKLRAVVHRSYRLDQMDEAHAFVEKGHKTGHVVVIP